MSKHRRNLHAKQQLYKPNQADEFVLPYLEFEPDWFIDCGPGSAVEFDAVHRKWPKTKLLGLEPSPAGWKYASARWPKGHTLIRAAIWDTDGTARLYYPYDLLHSTCYIDFASHLADNIAGETHDFIDVPAITLDTLDREYGPFENAFLWMDIEGAERRALRGAIGVLSRGGIRAINLETRPQFDTEIPVILGGYGFRKVTSYEGQPSVRDEVWIRP